ncbi:hypothetical protein D8B26_003564 [Coccidioides posadasii str. Silveira]|uniref:Uncharacterized protein n=1 Tax=Coccidioides posadasii (strain RMSCC 757 / Silveira) TaxID=443226 RepID=E9D0U9_COCPS|nr:hypothetical protein CPSG_03128 [Coccidioides posadasii str. Silveira]QVM08892.1 hypothetical protein D8B26_003564 [Coccidioides posadasii str. Silveira]
MNSSTATGREKNETTIDFLKDDPGAIKAMVRHMYGLDFETCGINRDHTSPLLFSVKVYPIADFYRVPQLKQRAKEKAEKAARTCWAMNDFLTAISEAYRTIAGDGRELRDLLVEVSREHIKELLGDPGFLEVLQETKGFAADLSKVLASGVTSTKYRCPVCCTQWRVQRCTGSRSLEYCPYCANNYNWDQYKC